MKNLNQTAAAEKQTRNVSFLVNSRDFVALVSDNSNMQSGHTVVKCNNRAKNSKEDSFLKIFLFDNLGLKGKDTVRLVDQLEIKTTIFMYFEVSSINFQNVIDPIGNGPLKILLLFIGKFKNAKMSALLTYPPW